MKTNEIIRAYREIEEDYRYREDIFIDEEKKVAILKKIINEKLSIVDKTIILLYVDCLSYRKLGERLGLSHMTVRKEVRRIIDIIKNEFNKI